MFIAKEQEEFFNDILRKSIISTKMKTNFLKNLYYFLTISTLFLSAVLTIILGLNYANNEYLILSKNIALIIGSTITFLTGLNTFWRLDRYWIRRRILLNRLEDLSDRFEYLRRSLKEESIMELFSDYQSLQNYQTLYWEDVYREKGSDVEKQQDSKI